MNRVLAVAVLISGCLPGKTEFVEVEDSDTHAPDTGTDPVPLTTVYNVRDDFSEVANPNGAWTFRAGAIPAPTYFEDWANCAGQSAWAFAQRAPGLVPSFFVTSTDCFDSLENGDFAVHAQDAGSPDNGLAQVVWTSPGDGTIDIEGDLWPGRNIGRATTWSLTVAGARVAEGELVDGETYDRANPCSFEEKATAPLGDIAVTAGDEVVWELVQATHDGEMAGLDLTIRFTE